MSIDIIQQRLANYDCKTVIDEENAIKEITQEIILMALARANFFKDAGFHGGTALRILYGVQRFSEDLDFALSGKNLEFNWQKYYKTIYAELEAYGYKIEMQDRTKADQAVKKAFIKDDSIGKVITLKHPRDFNPRKKIRIKLEIDTNPPEGAELEIKYLDFPQPFMLVSHTISSSFAGKLHALLCRAYVKGRDWYDFIWYVSQNSKVNFDLLKNALNQNGPYVGAIKEISKSWLTKELNKKIESLNWKSVQEDVEKFLKQKEKESLKLWTKTFFKSYTKKMQDYL